MTRNWIVALAVAVTLAPAAAFAHAGHNHKVLGTVASVQGDRLEIKSGAGKMIVVVLDAKTAITRGTTKVERSALKVGERVSVEAMEGEDRYTAVSVKLGATAVVVTQK